MKRIWPVLIVVIFAVLAGRTLIFQKGYFNMHDDLQMMRQLEMEKCFFDGQIPCRWVPDMGYGFGFPLFNYYPPLPYLIGEIFRIFGFSFLETVKLTAALSFIISGIAMYLLAKEFYGHIGGVLSAIFYIWAPYHAVDIYVRGAMNEAWALVWFPLILWTSYKLITEKKKSLKWLISLALSWFALLTSHNLMVLIFTPVFAGWCLLWLVKSGKKQFLRLVLRLIVAGVLAFGLAAFFTLPAVLEQKYVHVEMLVIGYYEYIAHFVSSAQLLFSRFWGYGPSVWGTVEDKMPFQIGHIHWILSLVIGVWVIYRLLKKRKQSILVQNSLLIILFFFLIGWFSAFMAHVRSTPIWLLIPPLKFVQFPWRFLTLTTLAFSFLAGAAPVFLKKPGTRYSVLCTAILAVGLVAFNWNYFLPQHGKMGALTDKEKFSGAAWELQQNAGIYDYLPKSAKENPKEPQKVLAEVMTGEGKISEMKQGTNWAEFTVKAESKQLTVRINIFQFPNWRVFVDGKKIEIKIPEEEKWGRMWIEVPQGDHQVFLKLKNTPIRTAGNLISLFSWLGLVTFPIWRKKAVFLSV